MLIDLRVPSLQLSLQITFRGIIVAEISLTKEKLVIYSIYLCSHRGVFSRISEKNNEATI